MLARFGPIDILVNNAGATWGAPAETIRDEAWHKVMTLNIDAMFHLSREVGRRCMIPRRCGKIINIASIAGLYGGPPDMHTIAYNTTKGAAVNFTRALAAEWGGYNINVNAVCPGFFPTKMAKGILEKVGRRRDRRHAAEAPRRRCGREGRGRVPRSEAARHVTGQTSRSTGESASHEDGPRLSARPPARHHPARDQHLGQPGGVGARAIPTSPRSSATTTPLTFARAQREAERSPASCSSDCGVKQGDRVLLFMQNSPQFVIAYYAILRADAVVVPVNPMNLTEELRHYVSDSGATVHRRGAGALSADAAAARRERPAARRRRRLLATTSRSPPTSRCPEFVQARRARPIADAGVTLWADALGARPRARARTPPAPTTCACMPYTSGTTGKPKGCMHTHRTVMSTAVGGAHWFRTLPDDHVCSACCRCST